MKRAPPSQWDIASFRVRERHTIAQLAGPSTSPALWAWRKAWESYLRAADECKLLDDGDLVSGLCGVDDEHFRGAMAECLVAWYFMRQRRMTVTPRPDGTATTNVDFALHGAGLVLATEVKAPFVPIDHASWAGGDETVLLNALKRAGKQCKKGRPNLVIVVPVLRSPVFSHRYQLIKATIGERVRVVTVSLDGSPAPPPHDGFRQTGHLAKRWGTPQGPFHTVLTRVSAVLSIEEGIKLGKAGPRVGHWIVAVHNPFASHPVLPEVFGKVPQWIVRDGRMGWSDKYRGL